MKPAFSVIFFTVGSGLGLGLMALLAIADLLQLGGGLSRNAVLVTGVVGVVVTAAGLVSSTFHLANPKNAWRAVSRWRTSWLSREGVFAVVFFPVALVFLATVFLDLQGGVRTWSALGTMLLAWAIIYSTGMIYACLKTIPQWHTPLTPANYLALGHFSASLVLLAVALADGAAAQSYVWLALGLLVVAAILKGGYYMKFRVTPGRQSLAGALGMTAARAKLLDAGHSHGTFLTREFGFELAREHATLLRYIVLAASFVLPLVALILGVRSYGAVLAVAAAALAGLVVERWLFFAEAQHVVRLFHGQARV